MERDDAEQHRSIHHRHVPRVRLEHPSTQLHHLHVRIDCQRVVLHDVGHSDVAEHAIPSVESGQHLAKRQHADQLAVIHHDHRSDVGPDHHLDRLANLVRRGRRIQRRVGLHPHDFADQHWRLLVRGSITKPSCVRLAFAMNLLLGGDFVHLVRAHCWRSRHLPRVQVAWVSCRTGSSAARGSCRATDT